MLSTRRFAALFVIGAAVAVPIVGCGASSGGGNTVDLTATDFKFDPSEPSVKSGNVTFNLKNDGQVTHSLEIEDVNGEDKELEGDVSPGSNGTLAVNLKPGTYEFYCP